MTSRPHVVVVGAGFGGLAATEALADVDVDVTLIDRRNHHLFQPLLYQVATAGLNPSDIAHPIRHIVRKQDNCRVLLDEVTGIDAVAKVVHCVGCSTEFDHLILATGATHDYFGNDEWADHAPGLKSIEDALEIRRRVLSAFEAAEAATDPDERDRCLTFVVVGAGPTGVELAGAIAEIALTTLREDFRSIDTASSRIVLVEAGDRVLASFPPELSAKAEKQLVKTGVDVRTGTKVTDVGPVGIETDDGPIRAATVLWAAGVAASPLGAVISDKVDRAGRVEVAADLSVPGHPDIFVIGDLAAAHDESGDRVPGVAPAAQQGGRHVAKAIAADVRGEPRPVFRYKDKGSMATIGRAAAVVDLGPKLRFGGFPAWVLWWLVHIVSIVDLPSRFTVLARWGWHYVTRRRDARLITGDLSHNDSDSRSHGSAVD